MMVSQVLVTLDAGGRMGWRKTYGLALLGFFQ
jgi:hypothetical protein